MKPRVFVAFVAPSLLMMAIFIAAPLISVFAQRIHVTQPVYEQVSVESCTPGSPQQNCVTETRGQPLRDAEGRIETRTMFFGLESYRNLLRVDRVVAFVSHGNWGAILTIDFWSALRFTLMFTLVTLPIGIVLGLAIALAKNTAVRSLRGPVIFRSLLPFIITPVIGALSIRWLFIGDGILTALLEQVLDRTIAMFAHGWTIELMMDLDRVWHVAPFAFVIFYAGLAHRRSIRTR